ncbi:DUF4835 family protein [Flavobacterium sp. JP2137]|uniref:type IX secretion system protein PorD n=1 Tax=Flavobacterium sp. JP2137 TaxID=3414510 RepID=UPI003D2FA767
MRKLFSVILVLVCSSAVWAQEFNATISVNHSQVGNSNRQLFKTLETSLKEFVNNTRWTSKNFGNNERIDCNFFLNVTAYDNNVITGSLQVQSARIIYNSTYTSPLFNFNDKDISFSYSEFENLTYNPNSFDSNLMGLMGYYINIILGLDADSFAKNGGTSYYQNASNIVSMAQQSGYKGWKQGDGSNNRYFLINDILSSSNDSFREALYTYHLEGLDKMADQTKQGKEGVMAAIETVAKLYAVRPNAFLLRVFFDAKADEIVSILSGGPDVNKQKTMETLNKISPLNASKWNNL